MPANVLPDPTMDRMVAQCQEVTVATVGPDHNRVLQTTGGVRTGHHSPLGRQWPRARRYPDYEGSRVCGKENSDKRKRYGIKRIQN